MCAVNVRVFRRRRSASARSRAPLGGCDAVEKIIGSDPPKPVDESPRLAREKVEAYLAAMTAKDRAAGKQHCARRWHGVFDKTATGENGDFNKKLTVAARRWYDVRAEAPARR